VCNYTTLAQLLSLIVAYSVSLHPVLVQIDGCCTLVALETAARFTELLFQFPYLLGQNTFVELLLHFNMWSGILCHLLRL
jgi:hypothetical protein